MLIKSALGGAKSENRSRGGSLSVFVISGVAHMVSQKQPPQNAQRTAILWDLLREPFPCDDLT